MHLSLFQSRQQQQQQRHANQARRERVCVCVCFSPYSRLSDPRGLLRCQTKPVVRLPSFTEKTQKWGREWAGQQKKAITHSQSGHLLQRSKHRGAILSYQEWFCCPQAWNECCYLFFFFRETSPRVQELCTKQLRWMVCSSSWHGCRVNYDLLVLSVQVKQQKPSWIKISRRFLPLRFRLILAGDKQADRCSRSKAEKTSTRADILTDHGLPACRRPFFERRYRTLSAARQSRASCKPLSSAVKRSITDVSMLVSIISVNIDPFRCTGGEEGCSQRGVHTLVRRSNLQRVQEIFENIKAKIYSMWFFKGKDANYLLEIEASLNLTLKGANISPEKPIISVSFSLRQEIAASTPNFSPGFFYFSQHQPRHSLWLI